MSYLQEFYEFSSVAKRIAYGVLCSTVLAVFFLSFPSSQSVSEWIFKKISADIVPRGVQLVSLSIWSSAIAEFEIAFGLGIICILPWFITVIISYFSPGLYTRERYVVTKILVPSLVLFLSGAMFAYYLLIGPTFSIMYSFADRLGAKPLLDVGDFVSTVVMLLLMSGIIFLLPIMMLALNYMGFVDKLVWGKYWRHAFFGFFAFSAIITPDGTGITMLIFALPMILLYSLGWSFSVKY